MREIKFRGKRIDNGEWVYGAFIPDATEPTHGEMVTWGFIRYYNREPGIMETAEVGRNTVGQFAGLLDKNGKEIYEGDIVRHGYENHNGTFFSNYPVRYSENDGAYMVGQHKRLTKNTIKQWSSEVIGNIHDNSELMEANP